MAGNPAFSLEALTTNRSGELTAEQKGAWQGIAFERRRGIRGLAYPLAAIGAILFFVPGPASNALARDVVGAGFFAAAALAVLAASRDALTADVRAGRVDAVEGAITKRQVQFRGGAGQTRFYFYVGDRRLSVRRAIYDIAPDAGIVRAFYFPRSLRVVNFERLADRDVPAGPGAARQVLDTVVGAVLSHDRTAMAEARATAAAFVSGPLHVDAAKAHPGAPIRREDLCGSWTHPMMSVTFASDGTAVVAMFGGARRVGHWSIDANGHLVTDATGEMEPVEASLEGDQLSVTLGANQIVRLTRVAES